MSKQGKHQTAAVRKRIGSLVVFYEGLMIVDFESCDSEKEPPEFSILHILSCVRHSIFPRSMPRFSQICLQVPPPYLFSI